MALPRPREGGGGVAAQRQLERLSFLAVDDARGKAVRRHQHLRIHIHRARPARRIEKRLPGSDANCVKTNEDLSYARRVVSGKNHEGCVLKGYGEQAS